MKITIEELQTRLKACVAHCLVLIDLEITDKDLIEHIMPFLNEHSNITTLDLRNNLIKDEGAEALSKTRTLTIVNLGMNRITTEGVLAFATNDHTIISMNLHGNPIKSEAASNFYEILSKKSKKLQLHSITWACELQALESLFSLNHHSYNQQMREAVSEGFSTYTSFSTFITQQAGIISILHAYMGIQQMPVLQPHLKRAKNISKTDTLLTNRSSSKKAKLTYVDI